MAASGVKPIAKDVHGYLISSYILWPLTFMIGRESMLYSFVVCAVFVVMGFLFYGLLIAMVKMSNDEKKRLVISQSIFIVSIIALTSRIVWLS